MSLYKGVASPDGGGTDADVRGSAQWDAVHAFYEALFAPAQRHVFAARELEGDHGGGVCFTGLSFAGALADGPSTALYRFDPASGRVVPLHTDGRLLKSAPDGLSCALVVANSVKIYAFEGFRPLYDVAVDGVIEQLAWSPGGEMLALLVAGSKADVSGAQGGFAMRVPSDDPAWLPEVDSGDDHDVWRRIWLWRPGDGGPQALTDAPVNVWEFCWRDGATIAAIASDHHGEGSWYTASLRSIAVADSAITELYRPVDQIALPKSLPSAPVAFVEAVCSDRGIVCGSLRVIDANGVRTLDTNGVDVTDHHWCSSDHILYAGLRGFETVVGKIDLTTGLAADLWASEVLTCGEWYPAVAPDGQGGALVTVESYDRPPALARIDTNGLSLLYDFAAPGTQPVSGRMSPMCWTAPDGLEIHGWLIEPAGRTGPCPLLIDIHGGPIWAHRNRWAARLRAAGPLAARGYAVLLPNPRGSAGRGQDFARRVVGDMGGADTHDFLSAVDHLVAIGVVDPARVAVTGTSYGGFMSAWLITQDDRFAAAVPISPVTNWYSQHYTSQIPSFDEACLEGSPRAAGGQYFGRSPVFFTQGVRTPTLTLAGARDKNTPPSQAVEFHHSLLEAGCTSTLCIYPEEGHSLRGYPGYLDSAVRTMIWLERYMVAPGHD